MTQPFQPRRRRREFARGRLPAAPCAALRRRDAVIRHACPPCHAGEAGSGRAQGAAACCVAAGDEEAEEKEEKARPACCAGHGERGKGEGREGQEEATTRLILDAGFLFFSWSYVY
jgi:hypothetical protein